MGHKLACLGFVVSELIKKLWKVISSTPNFALLALTWMPALARVIMRMRNKMYNCSKVFAPAAKSSQ
jgi:hypothetical protein